MKVANPNLTSENLDWLRKIQEAADSNQDPPRVPIEIAGKLREFGFVTRDGPAITDRGHGALLEQDMWDAEER